MKLKPQSPRKQNLPALGLIIAALVVAQAANARVIVCFEQEGNAVKVSWTGTLDLSL